MAKSFTQLVSDYKTLTNDSSTTNETLGKTLINLGVKYFLVNNDWNFSKDNKSVSSGTLKQYYDPPYNMLKMEYVDYWYKNQWFCLEECHLGEDWTRLNNVVVTAAYPSYWYFSNRTNQIGLFPIPADSKGTIKLGFTVKVRDYSVADVSTGTLSASANGTIFTSVGTVFTAGMEGRAIKLSNTDTVADGFWFDITGVTSGTVATVKQAIPVAISGASIFTISELIPFPDGYEDTPLWFALDKYYQMKENPVLAREYERMWKEEQQDMLIGDSKTVTSLIKKQGYGVNDPSRNPWNITITPIP